MNKLNTLDKVLIFIAILDVLFVIAMITVFCLFQAVPDSLIIAVFGATFGECGCCSYIWKHKKVRELNNEHGDLNLSSEIDSDNPWCSNDDSSRALD